jgi:hypothetical protein
MSQYGVEGCHSAIDVVPYCTPDFPQKLWAKDLFADRRE